MAQRILIVEDDRSILRGLEMNFQLEGFKTCTAADGAAALKLSEEFKLDLVVLDIMLPKMNGFEVLRELRRTGSDIPIILLSAKSAEMDVVMGLDLGADDYVTKPFNIGELIARVKAHLRRRAPAEISRFGDVEIDWTGHRVSRNGDLVELTQREFNLLRFLVEREGKALTREVILAGVWGRNYFGTDRTVDNFITRLRQKLDESNAPRHFMTVRGVGYRFVGDDTEA